MQSNESDFYRRREGEERALAERASSKPIRTIHLQLAERYAQLAMDVAASIAVPLSEPIRPTIP